MTRISAVFILTLLSVLGVVGVLLLPSAAQADCAQWDLSGHWVIQQGNGIFVYVDLTQTGTDVRGTGTWGEKPTKRGSITGTIDANGNILLNADWGGVTHCIKAPDLTNAVQSARRSAVPGDVVLLSPGTSSFDMFKNYADRGNQFRQLVQELT